MSVVIAISAILKVWMVADALRRGYCCGWPWIIIALPGGEIAYFLLVKFDDPQFVRGHILLKRLVDSVVHGKPRMKQLRYLATHAPTLSNKIALARELIERREFAEALPLLDDVRRRDPTDREGRYYLALVFLALGRTTEGRELLSTIVAEAPKFYDHAAACALVDSLISSGDSDHALTEARALMARAPCTRHGLLLAQALRRAGRESEAAAIIEKVLFDYDHAPWFQRRAERMPARTLRDMTRQNACARPL